MKQSAFIVFFALALLLITVPAIIPPAPEPAEPALIPSVIKYSSDKPISTYSNISSSVLIVESDDLKAIAKEAKAFIDSGRLLYVSAPKISNEEISEILGIDMIGQYMYNEGVLLSSTVYKASGTEGEYYTFANSYDGINELDGVFTFGSPVEEDTQMPFPNPTLSAETTPSFYDIVSTVEAANNSGDIPFIINPEKNENINRSYETFCELTGYSPETEISADSKLLTSDKTPYLSNGISAETGEAYVFALNGA